MAACGVVLCLVSLIFDAAPLFVPAVGLIVLGVGTPAWVWLAARGAATQRHLPAERVIEDEPVEATIEVRRGRLGLPGAEVVDPFTGSRFELTGELSPVRGDRTTSVRVSSRFARRGLHRLPAPALTVRDPLELTRAEAVSRAGSQQVLVLPRTEPVRWLGSRPQPPPAPARRPRRLRGAGRRRPRRATPLPQGDARQPDPLAGGGARRRADRAPAAGRRRRPSARRARRPHAASAGRAGGGADRRRGARGGVAGARVRRAPAAAGCSCPASSAPTMIDRELIAWPAAYARLALVEGGSRSRAPVLGSMAGARRGDDLRGRVAGGAPGRDPRRARRRARRCSSCPRTTSSAAIRAGSAPPRARRSRSRPARASCSAPAGGMSARARRTWSREGSAAADERRGSDPRLRRRRPAPTPRRRRTARRAGRAAVGAPGHLHRAGRLRARALGDADAPRAGLAADRACWRWRSRWPAACR